MFLKGKENLMGCTYDDIYILHAWRDNRRYLMLTQGEGYSGTLTDNDIIKAPQFQLRDERGIIEIPENETPVIQLAVTKPNRTEDLLECIIVDRAESIISIPITKSLTDFVGDIKGEIRLITANAVTKFYGINFMVFDGVSDNAGAQSSQFTSLISALQRVGMLTPEGTIVLDDMTEEVGVNPVASGVLKEYLKNNYMGVQTIENDAVDVANNRKIFYLHIVNHKVKGFVLFTDYDNYGENAKVCQYRFRTNGKIEYRIGTVVGDTNPDEYFWDKNYGEDWHDIAEQAAYNSIIRGIKGITPDKTYNIHRSKIQGYLDEDNYDPNDYSYSNLPAYIDGASKAYRYDQPSKLSIVVPTGGVKINIRDLTTNVDWEDSISGTNYNIWNLIPNRYYAYTIHDDNNSVLISGTCMATGYMRAIAPGDNVYNVRDIGGWLCDSNGRLKHGVVYRGCELNRNVTLTSNQKVFFKRVLGICDEIDLRSDYEVQGITDSALGVGVDYKHIDLEYYQLSLTDSEMNKYAQLIKRIANDIRYNKPVYIHCQAGADRTACLCMMIEAICGVSQSDIDRDYELTSFAFQGNTRILRQRNAETDDSYNWKNFITTIANMDGDGFNDKVVRFLLRAGATIDDINTIRLGLIEGNPEKLLSPYGCVSVSKTLDDEVYIDNDATITEMYQPYRAIINSPSRFINSVVVTMDGENITSECYKNGVIDIKSVTGNISITITTSDATASQEGINAAVNAYLEEHSELYDCYTKSETANILRNRFPSVKDYGAKGDGTTDDTDAIYKTIVENDVIYFPPGTYRTAGITITNSGENKMVGKTLFGAGRSSIIKPITVYGCFCRSCGHVQRGEDGKIKNTLAITDFSPKGGGYYLSDNQTEIGHDGEVYYIPIPYGESDSENVNNSFSFTNSLEWANISIFAKDKDNNIISVYPVDDIATSELNKYGQTVYTITPPQGTENIIIQGGGCKKCGKDISYLVPLETNAVIKIGRKINNDDTDTVDECTISDITIDAREQEKEDIDGIVITPESRFSRGLFLYGTNRSTIHNINIFRADNNGFEIAKNAHDCHFTDIKVKYCGANGIKQYGFGNSFVNVETSQNIMDGINITAGGCQISNVKTWANRGHGFRIDGAKYCMVANVNSQQNRKSGLVVDGDASCNVIVGFESVGNNYTLNTWNPNITYFDGSGYVIGGHDNIVQGSDVRAKWTSDWKSVEKSALYILENSHGNRIDLVCTDGDTPLSDIYDSIDFKDIGFDSSVLYVKNNDNNNVRINGSQINLLELGGESIAIDYTKTILSTLGGFNNNSDVAKNGNTFTIKGKVETPYSVNEISPRSLAGSCTTHEIDEIDGTFLTYVDNVSKRVAYPARMFYSIPISQISINKLLQFTFSAKISGQDSWIIVPILRLQQIENNGNEDIVLETKYINNKLVDTQPRGIVNSDDYETRTFSYLLSYDKLGDTQWTDCHLILALLKTASTEDNVPHEVSLDINNLSCVINCVDNLSQNEYDETHYTKEDCNRLFEKEYYKTTYWHQTPDDVHYPSEKLVRETFIKNPVLIYDKTEKLKVPGTINSEKDSVNGLINQSQGEGTNHNISSWNIEGMDLSNYRYIRVVFRRNNSGYATTGEFNIPLDCEPIATRNIYVSGATVSAYGDRNRLNVITCAIDNDKTKFSVTQTFSLYGTAVTIIDDLFVEKIYGCF